jgi:hypothetical protein
MVDAQVLGMPKGLSAFLGPRRAPAGRRPNVADARYNKIMNAAAAAEEYWATVDDVEAFKSTQRRFDNAVKVLKQHMVTGGLVDKQYLGILLRETPGGRRLDQKAAIAGLGTKLDPYFEDTVRHSLIPAKRPKRFAQPAS